MSGKVAQKTFFFKQALKGSFIVYLHIICSLLKQIWVLFESIRKLSKAYVGNKAHVGYWSECEWKPRLCIKNLHDLY